MDSNRIVHPHQNNIRLLLLRSIIEEICIALCRRENKLFSIYNNVCFLIDSTSTLDGWTVLQFNSE